MKYTNWSTAEIEVIRKYVKQHKAPTGRAFLSELAKSMGRTQGSVRGAVHRVMAEEHASSSKKR